MLSLFSTKPTLLITVQHHITMKYENQDGKLQTKSHET